MHGRVTTVLYTGIWNYGFQVQIPSDSPILHWCHFAVNNQQGGSDADLVESIALVWSWFWDMKASFSEDHNELLRELAREVLQPSGEDLGAPDRMCIQPIWQKNLLLFLELFLHCLDIWVYKICVEELLKRITILVNTKYSSATQVPGRTKNKQTRAHVTHQVSFGFFHSLWFTSSKVCVIDDICCD